MKKSIALLILAGLAVFRWTYHKRVFGRSQLAKAEAIANAPVTMPNVRDIKYIQVRGQVQAATEWAVTPQIAGRIKTLHVSPGDQVKSGDTIVNIDYLAGEEPYEEDQSSKTEIHAPRDGTIVAVYVAEGQAVNIGTPLMTIGDLSKIVVQTHINQVDAAKIALKETANVTVDSIPNEQMSAAIFIAPVGTVKNSIKGFDVQAVIEKPDSRLRPGMIVQLTIPTATR